MINHITEDVFVCGVQTPWGNKNKFINSKKKILTILYEQQVSISDIRYLFENILEDIEKNHYISVRKN